MITCPCKDCTDREIGCHSTCEKYINWCEERQKYKAAAQLENDHRFYRYYTTTKKHRYNSDRIWRGEES